MYFGKTLFAQLMDFLPWKTFHRIVDRCDGDRYVKSLTCADQFRVMAFAQLTYRESLRDIEGCLSAQSSKLYHMGFRQEIKRTTLADANETRNWRIHEEFAQHLIVQARKLYIDDSFGIDLKNTAYALDSTTIDLCLSLFPWALFRTTKSAVKMHPLLDLRGNIPSFIHISDGKLGDVNVLDVLVLEAGAIYVMDRGYLDFSRFYVMHQAQAFFVTRAKSNTRMRRVYSAQVNRSTGIICALYKARWQVELFFKWIKQHLRIKKFYGNSENAVKSQIWIAVSVYVLVAIVKKRLKLEASLYTLLQIFSLTLFEKMPIQKAFSGKDYISDSGILSNQLNLFAY